VSKEVIFYFDVGSPTSYLASRVLPRIARERGAVVVWKPVLLGGIFKATGNAAPGEIPTKAAWMFRDIALWADKWGVEFEYNPAFPINTLALQRGAAAYEHTDKFATYIDAVFSAMWEKPQNLGDPATLAAVLTAAGFDADDFKERIGSPEVKERLKANTDEAVRAGAFGCPTFVVGNELFFGQDRLEFVSRALEND
jgi:2-hydroxychromene-2-carboxylate isomerase